MTMDDLIAFIKARLDEDEAAAKRAESQDARHEQHMPEAEMRDAIEHASRRSRNYDQPWWAANMRYQLDRRRLPSDPARVLREVAGARNILARYEDCLARMEDPDYPQAVARDQAREYEDFVLTNLTAAWSDHPDYRSEWTP